MVKTCANCGNEGSLKKITLGSYILKNVEESFSFEVESQVKVHNYVCVDQQKYGICKKCIRDKFLPPVVLSLITLAVLIAAWILAFRFNLVGRGRTGSFPFPHVLVLCLTLPGLIYIVKQLGKADKTDILKEMVMPKYKERLQHNSKVIGLLSGMKASEDTKETKKSFDLNKAIILTEEEAARKFNNR